MGELWQVYENTKTDLYHELKECEEWGLKRAKAEKDYKVALKQKVLELKAEGQAVGIIDKTCYGYDNVAELRLERDIADTKYEVSKERINALKLNLRILDNQIQREWGAVNGG